MIDCQRAVQDAAGDLAAFGHFAKRRRFDRGGHLRVDRFHRREQGHFGRRNSKPARKINRILGDLALLREPGGM
jgi:hypothetical protein